MILAQPQLYNGLNMRTENQYCQVSVAPKGLLARFAGVINPIKSSQSNWLSAIGRVEGTMWIMATRVISRYIIGLCIAKENLFRKNYYLTMLWQQGMNKSKHRYTCGYNIVQVSQFPKNLNTMDGKRMRLLKH